MDTAAQIKSAKTSDLIDFYNEHNVEKPIKKFSDRSTAEKRCIDLLGAIVIDLQPEVQDEEDEEPAKKELSLNSVHLSVIFAIALSDYTSVNGAEPASLKDIGWVWRNTVTENVKQVRALEQLILEGFVRVDRGTGADAQVTLSPTGFEAYKFGEKPKAEEVAPAKAAKKPKAAAKPKKAKTAETEEVKPKTKNKSNAEAVAASWADASVSMARLVRDKVQVTHNEKTETFRSVAQAFEHFKLPMSKHIRFRLKLKSERKAFFLDNGREFRFEIA